MRWNGSRHFELRATPQMGRRCGFQGNEFIRVWIVREVHGKLCWIAATEPGHVFTQRCADKRRRRWSRWLAEGFFHFAGLDGQATTQCLSDLLKAVRKRFHKTDLHAQRTHYL